MTHPTTESLRAKMEAAHRMVVALCKPKGDPDRRSWSMSIPALPDYDPDLVIGAGLRAGLDALARLEMAEQERREFLVMLDFAYHLRFVDDSNSQEEQYSFWGKVEDAIAELAALAREETTSPSARLAM